MSEYRTQEENLILISTVEEYAFKHKIEVRNVLDMFYKNNIPQLLRSQYEVLHMMDLSDSLYFVEDYLEKTSA